MEWYKHSKFRNLVDMHINNGDESLLASFDADTYAKNMKTAGFDTAYIYGSNCLGLCLFPSEFGYRHQITYKRDIFGETVEACRKQGIRPVGYLNNWTTEAYNRHPKWRVIGIDKTGHRDFPGHDGRYGVCCFNSGYREYFIALVKEFCSKYDIEGLWIDMVGFWREACYCESCRRKFYEKTGCEIPEFVDWESPVWKMYAKFRRESMESYAKEITKAAKEVRPEISVSIQCASWRSANHLGFSMEYFNAFDYSAGDFYTDVREQAVDCKFLRSVSKNQPFEYMVPRCPDLTTHTISKPVSELIKQAYSSFLHGGAFLCIDAIDPKGTLNSEVYKNFSKIKEAVFPYFELPSALSGEYISDVAVYMNYESAVNMKHNGMSASEIMEETPPLFERFKFINDLLSRRHIQYDIINPIQLDRLFKYPVIILSELYTLTEREIHAFSEYVKGGGRLYISGRTGVLNDMVPDTTKTLRREDFALCDIMGVSMEGELPYETCYVKGLEESELFSKNLIEYPLGINDLGVRVKALDNARVLANACFPFSNHNDSKRFITAISDPPWEETDIPVLVENDCGNGKCIYSSLLLENDMREAVGDFWLDIIETLIKEKRQVIIDAPLCMEASVKKVNDEICISLLNVLYNETRSCAGESKIKISGEYSFAEVFPSGKVTIKAAEKETLISASELPELAVITLRK